MATVKDRLDSWAIDNVRWDSQVNYDVLLSWYNKGLQIFQKHLLEFVANSLHTTHIDITLTANQDVYDFPFSLSNLKDFYSIVQLRVAYRKDKNGNPIYRVCRALSLTDYNITKDWYQKWAPRVWGRISKLNPRYSFVGSDKFRIYPTPDETITQWISLDFNYFLPKITNAQTDESELDLPWYFLDAIDDYMTYRLYQVENPELAAMHLQNFQNTLNDNIYGLNRDKRPVEEWFADTRYFSHY